MTHFIKISSSSLKFSLIYFVYQVVMLILNCKCSTKASVVCILFLISYNNKNNGLVQAYPHSDYKSFIVILLKKILTRPLRTTRFKRKYFYTCFHFRLVIPSWKIWRHAFYSKQVVFQKRNCISLEKGRL